MDGDLLARARGGDLAAFEAIAVERLPGLYRLAHAILGGDGEAAEATCNTLVGAWHEIPHLDDPARLDESLDRILVSECRMGLERASHGEVGPPRAARAARGCRRPRRARPAARDEPAAGARTSWTARRSSASWTVRLSRSTSWTAPC